MIRACQRCGLYEAAEDDEWCTHCIRELDVDRLPEETPSSVLLRHYYSPEDLIPRIEEYEAEYGLPSEELLQMWQKGMKPKGLSHYDRHLWLSYFREVKEYYRGRRQRTDL